MKMLEEMPTPSVVRLKNLLFATDFSAASRAALPFVTALARRYDAKLYLAHVLMPESYPLLPPEAMADAFEQLTYDAEHQLDDLGNSKELQDVEHEMLLEQGPLRDVIPDMLKAHDIDLIVIGTHGRRGFKRFLLGSVAEQMFRNSPCPVLTVGPHVRPREEADFQIRQILCPSDLTERSFSAVPYAISMAAECSAHLTLLHVVPEELAPEEDAVFAKVKLNGAMQRLFPAEARPWSDFEIVVQSGKPADVIAAVAKTRQADLIVLGVRTADALTTHMEENTAYRVVTEAECPVMTVPEKG